MAKLKLDKESLQGFFFNHTEKIVLAVVVLLLGVFIWSGSSLEGIGGQSPVALVKEVESAEAKIVMPTWDVVKEQYTLSLDHLVRKEVGDAPTAENYYILDTPLIGSPPNHFAPREDPQVFAVTDVVATVVTAGVAFKMREGWKNPFEDLANMEQNTIEAPKKRKKKKKKRGGMGEDMEMGMEEMMEEMDESMSEGMGGMEGMFGMGDMEGGGAVGPVVRADAKKFPGYRPTSTATANGSSVVARSYNIVSVTALVPYQQQWDEFKQVFSEAAGYRPSRDIPRYLSFRAKRAEVPSDPTQPLDWGTKSYIAWTERDLDRLPKWGWAGFPGELADSKYLLPGVLTMPVPPVMMRDLRKLAVHPKVPLQEETKTNTVERAAQELIDVEDVGSVADIGDLPTDPGARRPAASGGGYGMGMSMGEEMDMGEEDMEGMYGGGEGMYGGGMSAQLVRGPQAEFLMVRFFDFIKPGKEYVYRVQVVLEDPNHPQIPRSEPDNRHLADTVRTRLAALVAEEEKQALEKKTPVRLYSLTTEWSEPSAPVSVSLSPETYAGGVVQPRTLDVYYSSGPEAGKKSGYTVPADVEPTADVMSLNWDSKYAVDLPGILAASRGTVFSKLIQAEVINPVTLTYKTVPDYKLNSGELVVDLRGGEVLEEAATAEEKPLLTPGEVAVIDRSGNFIVRNELDDWQIFDKYAPPPPIVIEAAPSMDEAFEPEMEMDSFEGFDEG